MRSMRIAELKAFLSETLARVTGGEEVLVTEDDRLIARLVPPSAGSPAAATQSLVARGLIRPPQKPLDETFWKLKRPAYRAAASPAEDGFGEWELREAV
ncbi:MAG: type II toxin-antitoxin system Phd/YefM family antitoxin [Thermoanaerobaculia bacterium]